MSGCGLCHGSGVWIYEDRDPVTNGVAGWVAEVCPNCDAPPPLAMVAEMTPGRLVLAEEALAETERYFGTLRAFCRGLMSYGEWMVYLAGRTRRIAEWSARRAKLGGG